MSNSARFWDRMADRYARRPIDNEAAYEYKLAVTRDHLQPDMSMLELGCGTGGTAILHAPHVHHVHATDLSVNMLSMARDRAAAANVSNISFEQTSVEEIAVADESYDAVLAMSLLHLLPNRHAAIVKIRKILKPGGLFVSSTVCLDEMSNPVMYVLPLARVLGLAPPVKAFSRENLAQNVVDGGFSVDHIWQPKPKAAVFIVAVKPEPT